MISDPRSYLLPWDKGLHQTGKLAPNSLFCMRCNSEERPGKLHCWLNILHIVPNGQKEASTEKVILIQSSAVGSLYRISVCCLFGALFFHLIIHVDALTITYCECFPTSATLITLVPMTIYIVVSH